MCRADKVNDLALASRSEITIICTYLSLTPSPVHPSKLDRLLLAEGDLQPIVAKARQVGELARHVAGFLPPDLARQVRPAGLKDGKLAVLTDNAAAAAKLKLLSEPLSVFLAKLGWQVNSVSVRVQPKTRNLPQNKGDAASHKGAVLSAASLAELQALHDRMAPSPARDALQRLLEHQRRKLA